MQSSKSCLGIRFHSHTLSAVTALALAATFACSEGVSDPQPNDNSLQGGGAGGMDPLGGAPGQGMAGASPTVPPVTPPLTPPGAGATGGGGGEPGATGAVPGPGATGGATGNAGPLGGSSGETDSTQSTDTGTDTGTGTGTGTSTGETSTEETNTQDPGGGPEGGTLTGVEFPGSACEVPALPSVGSLTADPNLPDPFTKMDGTRIADKSEWLCRREEILQQAFEFIYGEKPQTPKSAVSGSVDNSRISVAVSDGGSASFDVSVELPSSGEAPYPAVIAYSFMAQQMTEMFRSKGVAVISYDPMTVGREAMPSGPPQGGKFYDVYGSEHPAGLLVAWGWGVSRILDVLEQDPSVIDPTKVAVTGCSRFGKGAFVAGALDARIALTIPFESGVGGTPALRLIGQLDSQANAEWPFHAISYQWWFSNAKLGQFATANNAQGDNTDQLPIDMHEIIGLFAPRGLYIMDNPSPNYGGLDRHSAYVTAVVGAKIFEALEVPENITYVGASGSHCQWRNQYGDALGANIDKFLLGDTAAQTGTFQTDQQSPPNPDNHYDWTAPTLTGEL